MILEYYFKSTSIGIKWLFHKSILIDCSIIKIVLWNFPLKWYTLYATFFPLSNTWLLLVHSLGNDFSSFFVTCYLKNNAWCIIFFYNNIKIALFSFVVVGFLDGELYAMDMYGEKILSSSTSHYFEKHNGFRLIHIKMKIP